MIRNFKRLVRKSLRKLGYDIAPYSESTDPNVLFARALKAHGIDLVIDVGANCGQFAESLRAVGYEKRIVSIEPQSSEWEILLAKAAPDLKWDVAPRMAVGDCNGSIEINIAANSGSSSLLPMLEIHRAAAPDSVYTSKQSVEIHTLDAIASDLMGEETNPFLKIDTQGYEWAVINGAKETLKNIRGVMCECSLTPMYEGEANWTDLVGLVESFGFTLWGIQPSFSDPKSGRLLQADLLFFRT